MHDHTCMRYQTENLSSTVDLLSVARNACCGLGLVFFLDGNVFDVESADIVSQRTYQPVQFILLDYVTCPTSHPATCEHRCEHVDRDSKRIVQCGRVEVHVRMEIPFPGNSFLDFRGKLKPMLIVRPLTQRLGKAAKVRDPWIFAFVDPMAEPGYLLGLSQTILPRLQGSVGSRKAVAFLS